MFVKINGVYIPLLHSVIDVSNPEEARITPPSGKPLRFRGEPLTALKAVLQLLEEKDKVVDLEKAFKRPVETEPPLPAGAQIPEKITEIAQTAAKPLRKLSSL